jgi:hypothetical protein
MPNKSVWLLDKDSVPLLQSYTYTNDKQTFHILVHYYSTETFSVFIKNSLKN